MHSFSSIRGFDVVSSTSICYKQAFASCSHLHLPKAPIFYLSLFSAPFHCQHEDRSRFQSQCLHEHVETWFYYILHWCIIDVIIHLLFLIETHCLAVFVLTTLTMGVWVCVYLHNTHPPPQLPHPQTLQAVKQRSRPSGYYVLPQSSDCSSVLILLEVLTYD